MTTDLHPDSATSSSSSAPSRPLALTLGDALGIGPEIIVRAWREGRIGPGVLVIGEPAVLRRAARVLRRLHDVPEVPIAVIDAVADLAEVPPGALPVLLPGTLPALA